MAVIETNPMIDRLRECSNWSGFAKSLVESYERYGSLTPKQALAANSMLSKIDAKNAERKTVLASKTADLGMAAIDKLFATARANGLKRPRFITERLEIESAGPKSRNPGALYVIADGAYAGKIVNGTFLPVMAAPADIVPLLTEIAADPLAAATKYGRDTGTCSCCGKKLTDAKSIAGGIGPVCRKKWNI